MISTLLQHIDKICSIEISDTDLFESFIDYRVYKKKELLLTEGQQCREKFFIIKGCVHLFFLRENGTEQTIDFGLENWWSSDFNAFAVGGIAQFSVRATENTEVLSITLENQKILLEQMPEMNMYFHWVFQKAYAASQMRIRYLYEYSKEELYQKFLQDFPSFTQRVPQYLLASFLGFSPEYLSEIRKKYLS